jgi:hypothetical protein
MFLSTTHADGTIVLQPCISAVSVGLHNEQSSGPSRARKRPSTNRRVVDGEPDIVRLLPNYLVPYRDRSPKTTRKSYTKVHPKIPPTVPFTPRIRGSTA